MTDVLVHHVDEDMPVVSELSGYIDLSRVFPDRSVEWTNSLIAGLAKTIALMRKRGGMNGSAEIVGDAIHVAAQYMGHMQNYAEYRHELQRRYYFGTGVALKAQDLMREAFEFYDAGDRAGFIHKVRHARRVLDCLSGPEPCDKAFANE